MSVGDVFVAGMCVGFFGGYGYWAFIAMWTREKHRRKRG